MRKADPRRVRRASTSSTRKGSTTTATARSTRTPPAASNVGITFPHLFKPVDGDGRAVAGQRARDVRHHEVRDRPPGDRDDGVARRHQHVPAAAGRRPPGLLRRERDQDPRADGGAVRRRPDPDLLHEGDHGDGPAAGAARLRDHRGDDRLVPRPRRGRQPARGGPEVLQGAVGQVQGVPEGEPSSTPSGSIRRSRRTARSSCGPTTTSACRPSAWTSGRCPRREGRGEGEVRDHRRVARGDDAPRRSSRSARRRSPRS